LKPEELNPGGSHATERTAWTRLRARRALVFCPEKRREAA
jgi:hypothetical protein